MHESANRTASILYASALLLIVSGLSHLVVFAVDGGTWDGPLSWRKPILFGISTGLTVLSIGWLYPKLKPRVYDRIVLRLFAIAAVLEVALITLQTWCGEASHFNRTTEFNAILDSWITLFIVFITAVIADLTFRPFAGNQWCSDMRLAARAGMAFLLVSCLIGFAILFYGQYRVSIGANPEIFGDNGVTKFPHGIAIHAIQLLPMLAWVLSKVGLPEVARSRQIRWTVALLVSLLGYAIVQTIGGDGRAEPNTVGVVFAACALSIIVVQLATLANDIRQSAFAGQRIS